MAPRHATKPSAENTPPVESKAKRKNKREEVLLKAAELIARQGFDGTSMRDIAAAVQILPGSLYYHFPSKEDMLIAIHERVVNNMTKQVKIAVESASTPWDRLEKGVTAHLEGLLETGHLVSIISPNFAEDREDLNTQLKQHRDAYEEIFKALFEALDIPADVDRRLLRLQLLGALNWVPVWYDPALETSPVDIASSFVTTLRKGLER